MSVAARSVVTLAIVVSAAACSASREVDGGGSDLGTPCDAESIPTSVLVECAAEAPSPSDCTGYPLGYGPAPDAGYPVGCRLVLPERSEFSAGCGPAPIVCFCNGTPPMWTCPL